MLLAVAVIAANTGPVADFDMTEKVR
jgi:hypothetical protein